MPDWIGAEHEATAERYLLMAERELRGISPTYEALCLGAAGDHELLARLDTLPPAKRQPNLLLGAVRFLGGTVGSYDAFRSFVFTRWDDVSETMSARRTQTNEPGRCATLLPALAAVDGPVALLEVGASAGLCLFPDRWSYRYDAEGGAHRVGDGPELACATTGPVPWPRRVPEVVWRGGLDLNPLDVTEAEDVRWLESLVWPEQTERFARLHAAVAIAHTEPPTILTGDLATDLVSAAAAAPVEATLVVFHSAVLAYVPAELRGPFVDAVADLRRTRPVVWIANEAPGVLAATEQPPGGPSRFVLAVDGRPVARTGPHGRTLDWFG